MQFIQKAEGVWGDRWDYSKVAYVNNSTKVEILCKAHGAFWQTPAGHLTGRIGCPKCRKHRAPGGDSFIEKLEALHPGALRFDKMKYVDAFTPVDLVCRKHGEFRVKPYHMLQSKTPCPKCGNELRAEQKRKWTLETFSMRGVEIHGPKYEYVAIQGKYADIVCPKHGAFRQLTYASSEMFDFIENTLGVTVCREQRLKDAQGIMWVDGVVGKLAIEYLGLYWHGSGRMENARLAHRNRRERLAALGYRYVAIYEDEWQFHRGRTEAFLRGLVGSCQTLAARKCTLAPIKPAQAREFYDRWHTLGAPSRMNNTWGLLDQFGQLVACMTLGNASEVRGVNDVWSLSRLAYLDGYRVVGGAKRLFKACLSSVPSGAKIVSYIDLDKFSGDVYAGLGFTVSAELPPDYYAVWPVQGSGYSVRRHKTSTKRSALAKLPGFREDESELANCLRMGIHRIYHSGRRKVEMVNPMRL